MNRECPELTGTHSVGNDTTKYTNNTVGNDNKMSVYQAVEYDTTKPGYLNNPSVNRDKLSNATNTNCDDMLFFK